MSEPILNAPAIKRSALVAGFDLCGIAESCNLDAESDFFDHWLASGNDGGLEYLRRNGDKRFDPGMLFEGARSVIVCAVSYRNEISAGYPAGCDGPKVSSYAITNDYHRTVKGMLAALAGELTAAFGDFRWRAFCDTAPLSEKSWAVRAGLGWQGRNSLLINPQLGSFLFLGVLVVDAAVDVYDAPYSGPGCADCHRCESRCPMGAILPGNCIDAGRCISRLTVEKTGSGNVPQAPGLHGWIFGCDECQSACPYNTSAPHYSNPAFEPVVDPRLLDGAYWSSLTPEEFKARFGDTPMWRTGLERIKSNIKR